MKAVIIILAVITCQICQSYAQGIFNQNATQTKYQLEQIAALKTYGSLLKKGYSTVKDGTNLIGNIKNGDLSLHTDHFNSLKTVNPSIKNDSRVKAVLNMQSAMVGLRQKTLNDAMSSKVFSNTELSNLDGLLAKLGDQSSEDLDELELIITDGKLQMTDDERIKQISKLYAQTQDKYTYLKRLNRNTITMAAARKQGIKDTGLLQSLYGSGN